MDIFNLCLINIVVLEAQLIPRSLNERADLLILFFDKDDWSINPSVFRVNDSKWGPRQSIGLHRITTSMFQGSTLNLPPSATAASMNWPRIGEATTIGSTIM